MHVWNRALRFRDMITEEAKRRTKILKFWKTYGAQATKEAFEVKRRTLFNWQHKLKEKSGQLESLNPGSRAPKKKRKRLWDSRMLEELRRLRDAHPNLGKEKLYPLLLVFCTKEKLPCPKQKTIGRLIKDMGGLRVFPQKITFKGRIVKVNRQKVLRKPKDLKAQYPGHVVALDTIERFVHGTRRYIITFEDIHTRAAFAWATTSHVSKAAVEFFVVCQKVFPFPFVLVLTDNGSEFKKHFTEALLSLHLAHYHTYPRTPKMNAHVERFNRTLQEEFVDFHANLLLTVAVFNEKLMDYLIFYNCERVHFTFENKLSPLQFLVQSPYYQLNFARECKLGWPHTLRVLYRTI